MQEKKIRKSIPKALEYELLYKAARTCAICREPHKPIQLHHIDQNPSNNIDENLIVLCQNCHDEAHTKHSMSKNLTSNHLIDSKLKWELEVQNRASQAMLPSSNLTQSMWTFINHEKLPRILKNQNISFNKSMLNYLINNNIVDNNAVPIFKKNSNKSGLITIYDRMEWDASQKLHNLYMEGVDDLIQHCNPIELGAIWTKTEFKNIIKPGTICFAIRGFHFRTGVHEDNEENRLVYAKANNIEIKLYANTRHMYGSSALYCNFSGNRIAAILMVAKQLEVKNGSLILHATPIAMGTGFSTGHYNSPHTLRYGWTKSFVS